MQIDQVQQLCAWLVATDIGLLELRGPDLQLRLRCDGGDAAVVQEQVTPAQGAAHPSSPSLTVAAPSVGVFLHAHPLHLTALAPAGTRVRAGETIGLLQIGALLLPVCAPQAATVARVRVAAGTVVGYGTPLVELDPL